VTGQRETTRYAKPSLTFHKIGRWVVTAYPYGHVVGMAEKFPSGWRATTKAGQVLGLYPTKQAAAEVLVKQAGYELGEL